MHQGNQIKQKNPETGQIEEVLQPMNLTQDFRKAQPIPEDDDV